MGAWRMWKSGDMVAVSDLLSSPLSPLMIVLVLVVGWLVVGEGNQ